MYPEFKYNGLDKSYGFPYRYDPRSNEISKSTVSVLNEIAKRLRNEPVRHINWYLIRKPAFFWSWNIIQGAGDAFIYPVQRTPYQSNHFFKSTHRLMRHLHWPLVLLCAAGSLAVWLPRFTHVYPENCLYVARFVSALLLYYTAIHIIGAPFPRYSIPLRPFLYGMAMFSLHMIYISVRLHPRSGWSFAPWGDTASLFSNLLQGHTSINSNTKVKNPEPNFETSD
jgi:hypothetical protein